MVFTQRQTDLILLVGRVLLSFMFILSGFSKITGFADTAEYMTMAGLPMVTLLLILTIVIEVGGGLMIALGWKARWGALAILIFIIPVTLTFHAFWAVDPAQVQNQMNHFMKNLTIIGGMLYVLAVGPGRYSFDKR